MGENAISSQEINNREHIAPAKTGDNIAAKKVASYGFNSASAWGRTPLPFVDFAYDDIVFGTYDSFGNPATITFNANGSPVRTLTLTADGSGNITEVARS